MLFVVILFHVFYHCLFLSLISCVGWGCNGIGFTVCCESVCEAVLFSGVVSDWEGRSVFLVLLLCLRLILVDLVSNVK